MNGLHAGRSAAPLMAAARVAAGVTSLTCHFRTPAPTQSDCRYRGMMPLTRTSGYGADNAWDCFSVPVLPAEDAGSFGPRLSRAGIER
jgi:hypothetical protein